MRVMIAAIIMGFGILCVFTNAVAATGTGYRQINNMGCHLVDNTCYVYVSGAAVGPPECSSTSIRWNEQTSPGGKNALALITSAFMAGKKVTFAIVDTCYGNYPTFSYFNIAQ